MMEFSIFDFRFSIEGKVSGSSGVGNAAPAAGRSTLALLLFLIVALAGCRQDMHDQPRYEPLEGSDFFADGLASRPVLEGTIARGQLREDELLYEGKVDGQPARVFPFPLTRQLLERGRERYDIFCSPCHGHTGYGDGMIVKRGFRQPPSFHIERLRNESEGHYYDAITNGFGAMYSYASRVKPEDRWAIIAYIRALQLSQDARMADVPPGTEIGEMN